MIKRLFIHGIAICALALIVASAPAHGQEHRRHEHDHIGREIIETLIAPTPRGYYEPAPVITLCPYYGPSGCVYTAPAPVYVPPPAIIQAPPAVIYQPVPAYPW